MYDEYRPEPEIRAWAMEAARSTSMASFAWKVCFGLAGAAIAFGLVGAVTAFLYVHGQGQFGAESYTSLAISEAVTQLVDALLPAGILLAAGAFLRLSVTRFEVDLADDGDSTDHPSEEPA